MFAGSARITDMTSPWRVTTWNVQGSEDPPIARLAEVVRRLDPDVLVLQEIRRSQCRRLSRQLGWTRSWHRKHHPYSPFVWWRTEGMAILTRHRMTDESHESLTPDVSTWTYRHRIVVEATVERSDGRRLRVLDLHLASDAGGAAERADQAMRARRRLDDPARLNVATIVAGDLNDHGDTAVVTVLGASTHVDAWEAAERRSAGAGATNPSHRPHQRLDHILVPTTARTLSAEVPSASDDDTPWAELSDHLPLTVEILPD